MHPHWYSGTLPTCLPSDIAGFESGIEKRTADIWEPKLYPPLTVLMQQRKQYISYFVI